MRVNVIGSGYMGKQISALFRLIGFDVLIWNYHNQDLSTQIDFETRKLEKILKIKAVGSSKFENNLSKFDGPLRFAPSYNKRNYNQRILV